MVLRFRYIRVSSDEQEESLTQETQIFELNELFKKNGWDYSKEYLEKYQFEDLGISGKYYTEKREGLRDLIDALFDNKGSELYIVDQSRLTRKPLHWFMLIDVFLETKTRIFTPTREIKFVNKEDKLNTNMKVVVDQYVQETNSDNAKIGIKAYRSEHNGKWGPTPKIKEKTFNYYYYQIGLTNITSLAMILRVKSRTTVYNYMKTHNIPTKKELTQNAIKKNENNN